MTPLVAVLLAGALCALPLSAAKNRLHRTCGRAPKTLGPSALRGLSAVPTRLRTVCVLSVGAGAGLLLAGATGAVAAIALAAVLWRRRLRSVRRISAARDERAVVVALDSIVAELRVGVHPAAACANAAREGHGRVATALGRASARAALGGEMAGSLRESGLGRRQGTGTQTKDVADAGLAQMAGAWELAGEHGIALAELLAAVRRDIAGRRAFRERTHAALAGPRATATVLAALPGLGVALGQLIGADPIATLCGGGWGGVLLVVGTGFVCGGLAWSDRIIERVAA